MNYLFAFSESYDGFSAYIFLLVLGLIIFAVLGLMLLPALVIAGLARRKVEKILNYRVNTVITQFDPPHGLSPAEIGLLYDMRCGQDEIMATIFSLEARKIIRIMDKKTVEIIDMAAYKNLHEYEKIAIRICNGETESLDKGHIAPIHFTYIDPNTHEEKTYDLILPAKRSRLAFAAAVQNAIEEKGVKMKNYRGAFFVRVLLLTLLFGLLPMVSMSAPVTSNGVDYSAWSWSAISSAMFLTFILGILLFPVYIITASTLVFLWTKIAGRYWLNTKQARALWPEIEGYRLFLKQVDLDNIQFESTTAGHKPTIETLPYALAFGFDTMWLQRLANRKAPS